MTEAQVATIYSLFSAMMFASTFVIVRIGLSHISTLTTMFVSLTINALILSTWSLIQHGFTLPAWESSQFLILAGLFAPLLGRTFQFLGMLRLGSNITTPITLSHPLVTLFLGVVVLDETLRLPGWGGAIFIISGTVLLSTDHNTLRGIHERGGSKANFAFPVFSAFAYGISILFRDLGVEAGSPPVQGATVTILTSWTVVAIYILLGRKWSELAVNSSAWSYLIAAGIFSSIGPVLMYAALQKGSVMVVAPIAATTPLFALMAMYGLSRGSELFNKRIIVGTLSTVAGVVLLTVLQ